MWIRCKICFMWWFSHDLVSLRLVHLLTFCIVHWHSSWKQNDRITCTGVDMEGYLVMLYPHLAFCTHLDGSELWINTVLNPSGIPWVTAAYANMTSQIHNDKLQRGYSQPTHSLWPAINLPLICSLTQLIIFTEKGWEGDPLLENYRNRWTILEHKSTNIMLFVIAQGMTSAVEFISCRV